MSEDTRINVKLKTGEETEINGLGPSITEAQFDSFLSQFTSLTEGDVVVLAGSIPSSLPHNTYERIAEVCAKQGVRVVLDISGEALKKAADLKPFLMKPNHHELGEMFETSISSAEEAIPYGKSCWNKVLNMSLYLWLETALSYSVRKGSFNLMFQQAS